MLAQPILPLIIEFQSLLNFIIVIGDIFGLERALTALTALPFEFFGRIWERVVISANILLLRWALRRHLLRAPLVVVTRIREPHLVWVFLRDLRPFTLV